MKNFIENIRPLMLKIREKANENVRVQITADEAKTIIAFYLEVIAKQ